MPSRHDSLWVELMRLEVSAWLHTLPGRGWRGERDEMGSGEVRASRGAENSLSHTHTLV